MIENDQVVVMQPFTEHYGWGAGSTGASYEI